MGFELLEEVLSQANLPLLFLQSDGATLADLKAVFASAPFHKRFGYPSLVENGCGLASLLRPESYNPQIEALYQALQERTPVTLELKLFTDQDQGCLTELSLAPVNPPSAPHTGLWSCVLHDLEHLKSLEHQLWDTVRESQLHNITLQRSLDRELLLRRFEQRHSMEMRCETLSYGMAEALCDALRADRAIVLYPEQAGGTPVCRAQFCGPGIPPLPPHCYAPRDSGLLSHLKEENRYTLKLDEVSPDGIFDLGALAGGEIKPARSMLIGALREEAGTPYGLMLVHFCVARRTGGHELDLFGAACETLGRALQRARLQQELIDAQARAQSHARELAVALENAQRINALQSDFVSMASHELRTPLAVIDGAVQLLLRSKTIAQQEDAGYIEKQLDKIRRSVVRMGRLVNSSLNLSAIEAGQIEFLPAPCNLRQTVEESCQRIAEMHPEFQFRTMLDSLPEQYFADAGLIERILTNLLENAVKYSAEDKCVELRSETGEQGLRLLVTDYGVGIPEPDLNHVFDKFYRAGNTTGIVGTGIGLYLARRMAQLHGGDLSVCSELGKGSVFTLTLPIMEE